MDSLSETIGRSFCHTQHRCSRTTLTETNTPNFDRFEKSYNMLWERFNPDEPQSKTYDELCEAMEEHYVNIPITVTERYNFYTRRQKEGETPQEYLAELRKLAKNCKFNAFLNEALREYTLEQSVRVAQSAFSVAQKTKEIRNEAAVSATVYAVRRPKKSTKSCWRCGEKHNPETCKYRDSACYRCKKVGHLKTRCPEGSARKRDETPDRNKNVEDETDDDAADIVMQLMMQVRRIKSIVRCG